MYCKALKANASNKTAVVNGYLNNFFNSILYRLSSCFISQPCALRTFLRISRFSGPSHWRPEHCLGLPLAADHNYFPVTAWLPTKFLS